MPEHLSDEASGWFRAIDEAYVLDDHGRWLLTVACEAFDRMREAQAVLERDGITCTGRAGLRVHPCVLIERDSRVAMLTSLRALCLDVEPPRDRPGRPAGSWTRR